MSEENKAIARRIFEEVWGAYNLDKVEEYYAANLIDHNELPGFPPGREGVKASVSMFASALSDNDIAVEDQIAEGDKVVTRWTAHGTHQGELMGIPATDKSSTITGINVDRITNGKIVESWGIFDQFGMMQQLGVISMPEPVSK